MTNDNVTLFPGQASEHRAEYAHVINLRRALVGAQHPR